MTHMECEREREIVRVMMLAGADGLSEEQRSHAATCEVCGDVVALAAVLRDSREEALRDLRVPAAGQIWWRSALRARVEANEAARRPIVWLQGILAACAVGVGAAIFGWAWPTIYEAMVAMTALPAAIAPDLTPIVSAVRSALPIALALLACLVLAPIVVYFALSDGD